MAGFKVSTEVRSRETRPAAGMSGFLLSPAARVDLSEIWDYNAERWGIEQAERYIRELTTACQELADQRRTGRAIDEIREGYFKLSVRILHQRMDLPERLG